MEAIPIYSKLKIKTGAKNREERPVPTGLDSAFLKLTASSNTSSRIHARKAIFTPAKKMTLTRKAARTPTLTTATAIATP